MAKKGSTGFSEDWLKNKGYTPDGKGGWTPPKFKNPFTAPYNPTVAKIPVVNTSNFVVSEPLESFLTIHGIVAGLNGNKGLMRGHWGNIKKTKDLYRSIIRDHFRENKVRKHLGSVAVTYIGYKSNLMDWDNFCASFKNVGDSLVKEGVILEDNPKVIQVFTPKQIKCKRIDQKVIVIIQDV